MGKKLGFVFQNTMSVVHIYVWLSLFVQDGGIAYMFSFTGMDVL